MPYPDRRDPCINCPFKEHPPPHCPRWACSDSMRIYHERNRYIIIDEESCSACSDPTLNEHCVCNPDGKELGLGKR